MMDEDRSTGEIPARAENLDDMLNTLIGDAFRLGQQDRWYAMPELQEQKQALIAYVARLEARQITPEMWALLDTAKAAGKEGNGARESFALRDFFAMLETLRDETGEG